MELQRTIISETPAGRTIEMAYSESPDIDGAQELVLFRYNMSNAEGYPRAPELQLLALRRLRDLISDEIQRLQHIPGQRA